MTIRCSAIVQTSILVLCLLALHCGRYHVLAAVPGSGVEDIPTVLDNGAATKTAIGSASDEKVIDEIRVIKETLKPTATGKLPPAEDKLEMIPPKDFLKNVLKDAGKIASKHAKDLGSKYGKEILKDVKRGDFEKATETIKKMGSETPTLVKHIGKELGKNAMLQAQRIDFFQRRRLLAIPGSGAPEESMAVTAEDDTTEANYKKSSAEFRFEGASQKVKSMNKAFASGRASKGGVIGSFLKGALGGGLGTGATIIGSGLISPSGPKYSCAKNAPPEEASFLQTMEGKSRRNTIKFLEVGQHTLFKAGHKAAERKGGKKGGVLNTVAALGGAAVGGALALSGAKKLMKRPKSSARFRYGTYQTWTDVEACEACSFVWSSVVNKANKWDRDELSTTFEDVCSDQPDIFAGPCKEMREKLNFMVSDLIAYKRVKPVCACADMGPCDKNFRAERTQHLYGYV